MKKENLPVIIAIALPILLVLVVAASLYFPGVNARPQYGFLYAQASWPYAYSSHGNECTIYANYYEIDGTHLAKKKFTSATSTPKDMNYYPDANYKAPPVPSMPAMPYGDPTSYCYGYARVLNKDAPDLYMYDAVADESKLISYEDAAKLTLVEGVISPDGYTVSNMYQSSGFFDMFGGNDGYGVYATRKNYRVKLSVPQLNAYGGDDLGFIAWVNQK